MEGRAVRTRLASSSPVLAVILLLMASASMAQVSPAGVAATGDQPGREETAPPQAASAGKDAPATATEPAAPSGIRLRWYGLRQRESQPSETRLKLEWKTAEATAKERLDGKLRCSSRRGGAPGEDLCFAGIKGYDGWFADFGDDAKGWFEPRLFFYNGLLYQYHVEFGSDDFSYVVATLQRALGQPATSKRSTVKNRMGAEFDQDILIWERGDVIVIAMRRGAKVTEGVLSVTYQPISKTIPKEPTGGEAPF